MRRNLSVDFLLGSWFVILLGVVLGVLDPISKWMGMQGDTGTHLQDIATGVLLLFPFLYIVIRQSKRLEESEQRFKKLFEEQKQAKEEIERLNLQNELILNSAGEGIFGIDRAGTTIFCNPAGAQMLGYEAQELVGGPAHEQIHHSYLNGDPYPAEECRIRRAVREGVPAASAEEAFWHKNGMPIPVEYTCTPIRWQGETVGAVVTYRDITERRKTEELMRRSDKLSVVGELAAGIAHEIRNPLTSLRGFIQLLNHEASGKTIYYDVMLSEIDRINFIVGELMLLVKPRALSFEQQDVRTILRNVVFFLTAQANLYNINLVMETDDRLPLVTCQENKLKQVFLNVLKNAIEAMPGGGDIRIGVAMDDEDRVRIRFQDQGCGIPADRLSKIGQPFHTTKETGTGLGLTVSWKIIEDHQGSFQIESEVGVGTTVEITLPVLQMEQDVAI
jgi:PAS domain S-box-containing protein